MRRNSDNIIKEIILQQRQQLSYTFDWGRKRIPFSAHDSIKILNFSIVSNYRLDYASLGQAYD